MMWKLRLLWYRTDKGALAFGVFFSLIVGALVFALNAVFWDRDAQAARARDFHARSLECLARNVPLIDCQMASPHLGRLGSRSIPRWEFEARLAELVDSRVPVWRERHI